MIDTHCHLDSARFDADRVDPNRSEALARAFAAGVRGIVIPAIGPADWPALLELGQSSSALAVALGIHPQLLPELDPADDDTHLEALDRRLAQGGVVAVGECGLDGPSADRASLARQLHVLKGHLALARKHQLPILVHCLRAHPALLALLEAEPSPPAGLLLHSYSGGADLVRRYLRLGCHFSFAGAVTFQTARKPLEAVRAVPLERLMIETDAPDQTPHPHRGERNEPAYLPLIAEAVAKARSMSTEELAAHTAANAARFFGKPGWR